MSAYSVVCPRCSETWDVRALFPKETAQATIICSACGAQLEVSPGSVFGYRFPKVVVRGND